MFVLVCVCVCVRERERERERERKRAFESFEGEVVGFGEKGMVNAAVRLRALSLYRALMRSVRTWPGPPNEKQYIYVSCMLSLSLSVSLW